MKCSDCILRQAEKPYYTAIVFLMTVCESIFLFVPPEVFMTPAIIANKRRAIPITLAATLGSIVGGAISYMIGLWLFDSVGVWLIEHFASMEKFYLAQQMFIKHGVFLIFLTAVTPIPYKLMCMTAGFIGFPFWSIIINMGIPVPIFFILSSFFLNSASPCAKVHLLPYLHVLLCSQFLHFAIL